MEDSQQDTFFQYGTFAVLGLTLVVCLMYTLFFLNPRLVPAAFRPPTPTVAAFAFQPTWTPTPTITPTPQPSATPTVRQTATPLPTETYTRIAPLPATPTQQPIPPQYATRAPGGNPRPANTVPPAAPRTSFVRIKSEPAPNCGTWYVQGTVWSSGYGSGFVPGTLVRVFANGRTYTVAAGSFNRNNDAYWEVVFPREQAQNGWVAIVSSTGQLLSPQYAFQLTPSCKSGGAVNQIIMDFTRQ